MIFERRITRKIFGPTKIGDGYWRIKSDQEINEILKGQNIIGFINPSAWSDGHCPHAARSHSFVYISTS